MDLHEKAIYASFILGPIWIFSFKNTPQTNKKPQEIKKIASSENKLKTILLNHIMERNRPFDGLCVKIDLYFLPIHVSKMCTRFLLLVKLVDCEIHIKCFYAFYNKRFFFILFCQIISRGSSVRSEQGTLLFELNGQIEMQLCKL